MQIARGATRLVFLTKHWAIKIPALGYGWRNFLYGLLANQNERAFSQTGWPQLCPVVFSIPGGWAVIMPRCEVTDTQMTEKEYEKFVEHETYRIPVENKPDSFGRYKGRIVAIDYGDWGA